MRKQLSLSHTEDLISHNICAVSISYRRPPNSSVWHNNYHSLIWRTYKLIHMHDDVIKWKHFPRYWPFVRGIHRSPVNSPHKGQWRGALMFTLICARINSWVNNCKAGDLRRNRAHYDVIVMDTASVAVAYGRLAISSALHNCCCYLIQAIYYLIHMT